MYFLTIREVRRKNKIRRLTNSAPDTGSLPSMHIAVFSLFVTKQREKQRDKIQRDRERKTKTERQRETETEAERQRKRKNPADGASFKKKSQLL